MRDKMVRSITLAVAAVVGIGMVSSVNAQTASDTTLACGAKKRVSYCAPKRKACVHHAAKKVAVIPQTTTTTITKTKVIEKPVVINPQVEACPAPAPVAAVETIIEQPAVAQPTPVIIDRYQKRHRSLLHLGLFPFNLLGE